MITEGGAHPPEKWADATAAQIVDIADHVTGEKRASAVKLQAAIIDVLIAHHTMVQDGERAAIKATGLPLLAADLNGASHTDLETCINEICAAASATPWADVFATDEMRAGLQHLLTTHMNTVAYIERSLHADANPDAPEVVAFRSQFGA
jgi:hypothetical protein